LIGKPAGYFILKGEEEFYLAQNASGVTGVFLPALQGERKFAVFTAL
jgi:hypothetical protein